MVNIYTFRDRLNNFQCHIIVILALVFALFFFNFNALAKNAPLKKPQEIKTSFFSENDQKLIKQAMFASDKEKWDEALAIASKAKDKTLKEAVLFRKYSNINDLSDNLSELRQFYRKYQKLPDSNLIRNKIELMTSQLLYKQGKISEVIGWFSQYPPKTKEGKKAYTDARIRKIAKQKGHSLNAQQKKQILRMVKNTWLNGDFNKKEQREYARKYKNYLIHADFVNRADRLLWQKKITLAKELFPHLSKSWQKLFHARIAMIEKKMSISKEFYSIPKKMQHNPGLLYDRIYWHYKKGNHTRAIQLISGIKKVSSYDNKWWQLRKLIIREMIEKRKYQTAYKLSSTYQPRSVAAKAEAKWLSGWLALRFIGQTKVAYKNFYEFYKIVKLPISKARAAYWLGRAAEANKNHDISLKWYKVAAIHPDAFYGQLAIMKTHGNTKLQFAKSPKITNGDIKAYNANKLLKFSYIFSESEKYGLARKYIHQAVVEAKSKGQVELITRYGNEIGKLNLSVEASKKASWRFGKISENGYPVIKNFSKFNQTNLEDSLAHAIIRQESLFDKNALSSAGAMGLMQLMPLTAKKTAQDMKLPYSKSKLKQSPTMNLKIGSFYLNQLVKEWNGSYILAIASYNAGPHNVQKWIKKFGDPRKKKYMNQVIDWMEMIPFHETRNYVQRVLENLQIYRSIINHKKIDIELIKHDLTMKGKSI